LTGGDGFVGQGGVDVLGVVLGAG
jgi:hypothetical protein